MTNMWRIERYVFELSSPMRILQILLVLVVFFSWSCFCIVFSSMSYLCAFCGNQGLGVVCNKPEGFDEGDFVVEFFGEVHTTILDI